MYMYVVTEFKHEFSCDVIRATACKCDQIYEKQSYTNYKYLEIQFEIFNSRLNRAVCMHFCTNLYLFKIVYCIYCTMNS